MKFYLATKNAKKLGEMQRILAPLGITVICQNDIDFVLPDVEETGSTFAENAYIKALAACKATGLPAIADDSGLCVDALNGQPGVYSARYAGVHGNDEDNIDKLLDNLEAVEDDKRSAHFACSVCCCFPDGRSFTVDGKCCGTIARERIGNGGFGYDPVFLADGTSFGVMTAEQKDKISHRGNALRLFAERIMEYID